MSYVERAAGWSAAAVERPKREPLPRGRLDLIYFALAAIDLFTIGCTLLLSNHIMNLYQESVNQSVVWSARVRQLVELAQHAQVVNAPGNDVFDTLNVDQERARRDEAMRAYRRHRDEVRQSFARMDEGAAMAATLAHLQAVDRHMEEMTREADQIFSEIEAGRQDVAGRRMATMDRTYAHLSRSLLNAIMAVQEVENAKLQRQVSLATSLRLLEFAVLGLIFLIVIAVALYGRRIGRVMRQTEDAHNDMLKELEETNEALEQYANNVAHELRSPVNKMLLASELALSRPRTHEEHNETLVSIVEECQRLSSIVGSLLFLARAKRTLIDLERQNINLAAELATIVNYFEGAATEGGVALTLDCPASLTVNFDRTLLQRAVSNLVANALAHTGTGGIVRISVLASEALIEIAVEDTGEGIDAEHLSKIFDRFYRADKTRNSTSGRIGLGLPITRSIMELHGGDITLSSQLGRGTKVTLLMPVLN